jgi:HSP20 family protein
MFREINRLHDVGRFFQRPNPFVAGAIPLVNVWEDEHTVYAETDLPGVDTASLDVSVTEGNRLAIAGERKPMDIAGGAWRRQERGSGTFQRTLTLPTLVDPNKVTAKYDSGVLRITLPKAEAAKPRRIPVIV